MSSSPCAPGAPNAHNKIVFGCVPALAFCPNVTPALTTNTTKTPAQRQIRIRSNFPCPDCSLTRYLPIDKVKKSRTLAETYRRANDHHPGSPHSMKHVVQ